MKVFNDQHDINRHGARGENGVLASSCVVQQSSKASNSTNDLAVNLMERICQRANLNRAYKRVKANKGSPGIDGMTVDVLKNWICAHKEQLLQSLLDGTYQPQPVKEVLIPKPGNTGETRKLGIPCVVDRLVQQAIHQVLEGIFDPGFSESSFGFRPGRGAHNALRKASEYVHAGHVWVVDIDVEKFFDRVNHDVLMSRLARRINDKRLLKIIRRFLEAGIMRDGVCIERHEGTPQGGPLSPLLSNILLDELDKELEKRGHKFCRYADDQNIYVRSRKAGERVFLSVKSFLEKRLRLRINESKSSVALTKDRKFLGYRVGSEGRLSLSPPTLKQVKDKIRYLTWRSRGKSFEVVVKQLNTALLGWVNYYRLCTGANSFRQLDSWIRRKLRCLRLKQRKRGRSISAYLIGLGINAHTACRLGRSGKGWWRLSRTEAVHIALDKTWFEKQGLMSLEAHWGKLRNT